MKIAPWKLSKMESHELFMAVIAPRPIALVSTVGEDGVFNLAPFASFNCIGTRPALICLYFSLKGDGQKKDTLRNIEFSEDFVVNVVTEELAKAMNQTGAEYPKEVDEFKEVGLTAVESDLVKSPRVAESPVNMECKLLQIMKFGEAPDGGYVVIGEVRLVHVRDEFWVDDKVDRSKLKYIGRLGGAFYCRTTDTFEMKRATVPTAPKI
jgi:flavin reductase (DIM6/NTAB) family NADH-FMN oxidoreductase RutF